MSDLGVGMIGLNVGGSGWAAEAHAPAVLAVEGLRLVAVSTRRQESADAAAAAFDIPAAYADPMRLIDDPQVDVVAVVSPVPTHLQLLRAAMEAGKHVLTEWPVAVGTAQIEELAGLARMSGVRTAVDLQARRSPAAVRAAALVAGGELGRILSMNVLSTTTGFGAVVPEAYLPLEQPETWMNLRTIQAAHTLDLAVAIAGPLGDLQPLLDIQYPALTIEGSATAVKRTLADHILIQGLFIRGGTLSAEIVGGRPADDTPFRMEVLGERGHLVLTGGGPRGFQAGPLSLVVNGRPVSSSTDPLDALPDSVVNVAHVYSALRNDIRAGTSSAPTFEQARELARLIDRLEA